MQAARGRAGREGNPTGAMEQVRMKKNELKLIRLIFTP